MPAKKKPATVSKPKKPVVRRPSTTADEPLFDRVATILEQARVNVVRAARMAFRSLRTPLATIGRGAAARALPVFPTATAFGRYFSIFAASSASSAPWRFASSPTTHSVFP